LRLASAMAAVRDAVALLHEKRKEAKLPPPNAVIASSRSYASDAPPWDGSRWLPKDYAPRSWSIDSERGGGERLGLKTRMNLFRKSLADYLTAAGEHEVARLFTEQA